MGSTICLPKFKNFWKAHITRDTAQVINRYITPTPKDRRRRPFFRGNVLFQLKGILNSDIYWYSFISSTDKKAQVSRKYIYIFVSVKVGGFSGEQQLLARKIRKKSLKIVFVLKQARVWNILSAQLNITTYPFSF